VAFDEKLAGRIKKLLATRKSVTEKKMFGGLSFFLQGNMCCGVLKDDLIVRGAPDEYPTAVKKRHVRPFDFSGRPMKGWLMIGPGGCRNPKALAEWVDMGARYALSLPPKRSRN
jgi:hypothetical protein